ncbi:unnamed protein product [Clavelina lepadiformis]|uniref:Uncharacterized protein n=1 Tax=Clavelina lepadiformis TaxID=159417 RepID=A0ABP0GDT5_CLALP
MPIEERKLQAVCRSAWPKQALLKAVKTRLVNFTLYRIYVINNSDFVRQSTFTVSRSHKLCGLWYRKVDMTTAVNLKLKTNSNTVKPCYATNARYIQSYLAISWCVNDCASMYTFAV